MAQVLLALVLVLAGATALAAQILPTEPVTAAGGRVVIGAEVTATVATADPGFFNYTDDEYSALRTFRVEVRGEWRASRRLQVLGALRVDRFDHAEASALFVRVRPWPEKHFDIQAGRIPTTFGAFGRSTYGTANMVIGTPLAYQYLTSLRADALPDTSADLLRMRGRGWRSNFPIGATNPGPGLAIINGLRTDTGVQAHGVSGIFEWTGALTTGTLSNPRVRDDNDGRQVVGRLVARPVPWLAVGTSAARGAYVSRALDPALPGGASRAAGVQRVAGLDAEYSMGRFLARGEIIGARWTLPLALRDTGERQLDARSVLVEARYRLWPGVQVAIRADRLDFADIGPAHARQSWEAPVRRLEAGGSYAVIRNLIVKMSLQRNVRAGGRVPRDTLAAAQVMYWF